MSEGHADPGLPDEFAPLLPAGFFSLPLTIPNNRFAASPPVSVNDSGIITGEKFVPIPSPPGLFAKAARSGETSIPVTRSHIARLTPEPSSATGSDSISAT